jgi:hypothetical protein
MTLELLVVAKLLDEASESKASPGQSVLQWSSVADEVSAMLSSLGLHLAKLPAPS